MTNSDEISSSLNTYFKSINLITKACIPKIDSSIYINPFIETTRVDLNPLYESINLSLQPLIDHMDKTNRQIASLIGTSMSNIVLDSLNNLKVITTYTAETIESISKTALAETLDDVCNSLADIEFNDESITLAAECKSEIITIKNDLSSSNSKEIDIHQWIATITAIIGIILSILSNHSNSNEVMIEQTKQLIEIESSKLEKLESIDNTLKRLIQPTK